MFKKIIIIFLSIITFSSEEIVNIRYEGLKSRSKKKYRLFFIRFYV